MNKDAHGQWSIEHKVHGLGYINDLIQLGCESYKYAINQAIEKWKHAEPETDILQIHIDVSQSAMKTLMSLGSGLPENLIEELFEGIVNKISLESFDREEDQVDKTTKSEEEHGRNKDNRKSE